MEFIQSRLLFSFLRIINTFVLHIDFVDVTGALGELQAWEAYGQVTVSASLSNGFFHLFRLGLINLYPLIYPGIPVYLKLQLLYNFWIKIIKPIFQNECYIFLLESVTVARPAPPDALLVSTPICGEYYI